MQIWAIGTTRNEADIIAMTVRYHLRQGIDHFIWVDDSSTDGTDSMLEDLSSTTSLEWRRHSGPFQQNALLTALAREAYIRGADWVLPLDADEFWYAPGTTLRDVIERSSASSLRVGVVNYVQDRKCRVATANALLSMTHRVASPVGPIEEAARLVDARAIGFVEIRYPSKWIARTSATLEIGWGNHSLTGNGQTAQDTDLIVCLHAPASVDGVAAAKDRHLAARRRNTRVPRNGMARQALEAFERRRRIGE